MSATKRAFLGGRTPQLPPEISAPKLRYLPGDRQYGEIKQYLADATPVADSGIIDAYGSGGASGRQR